MHPFLRCLASNKAPSVSVIIQYPATPDEWRKQTSQSPLNICNTLSPPIFPAQSSPAPPPRQPPRPPFAATHFTSPLPFPTSSHLSQSQGDTDGVVLATISTQLLPGHRAQTSAEPSKASVLHRKGTRHVKAEIKGWRQGRGWKVTRWLLQRSLTLLNDTLKAATFNPRQYS